MRIGSTCSGYGGLDLAVEEVFGASTAWHFEYEAGPSKILAHHWPGVPNYGDLTTVDWSTVESVDILTSGYPCQPFSQAGARKGHADERHLWPYIAEAIRALRPRYAFLENVRGHLSLGFGDVLGGLADLGYDAQWVLLRASDVGAPHQRARVFILATDARGEERKLRTGPRALEASEVGRNGSRHDDVAIAPDSDDRTGHGKRSRPESGEGSQTSPDARSVEGERRGKSRYLAGAQGGTPAADGREQRPAAGDRGPASSGADGDGLEGVRGFVAVGHHSDGRDGPGEETWGAYWAAVDRWQRLTRRAPGPTEPSGRAGAQRLSPRFVEWMMGLPDGWVTSPAIGLKRSEQLKALGNGVVPAQAVAALRMLLHMSQIEVAA